MNGHNTNLGSLEGGDSGGGTISQPHGDPPPPKRTGREIHDITRGETGMGRQEELGLRR